MKVTKAKTGTCEYTLDVEVESERLERPLQLAAQRICKRRPLPGFRPGKAPYAMVERLYGKAFIVDEMLETIGNDLYADALTESGLEAYAPAHLKIVQSDPLKLQFAVATRPEVTLGDYRSVRVPLKPAKVRKADVDQVVSRIQEQSALWIPVDRALKLGDQVVMDAAIQPEGQKATEQKDVTVVVSEELTPPGLGTGLVGIQSGESKELDLRYPADYRDPDLADKQVHLHVSVKAVKEKELPALDDELAKSQGSFDTMAKLRESIEEQLKQQRDAEAKEQAVDQAVDSMLKQATLEYPSAAVDREVDLLLARYAERLKQQGFTLENYLAMSKKTLAQMRDEMRPQGEKRLRRTLILSQFAQAESINVTPEEVQAEVGRISEAYGEKAAEVSAALSSEDAQDSVTDDLFNRRTLDRLISIVTSEPPAKPERKKRTIRAKKEEAEPTESTAAGTTAKED